MTDHQRLSEGFQFGEWAVKPEDGSLISSKVAQRLEPLLMQLLVFLCSRSGQVVSKNDVLERVWGGRFVSDNTVKASFYQLRKALGDSPRRPRFIETLPKRGYRVLLRPVPLKGLDLHSESDGNADHLYEKGKALLSGQPGAATLKQARLYFERVLQSQPDHAEASAALAHTYIHFVSLGLARGAELMPRSAALAARAIEIVPKLASGHVALGITELLYKHDLSAAEASFSVAIELAPTDALPHRWYAKLLSSQGRHDAAIAEARRALEADPLSLAVRRDIIEIQFMARRYDQTVAEAQQLIEMAGQAPEVQLGLAWVYFLKGEEQRSFDVVCTGFRSVGTAPAVLDRAIRAFKRGGMEAVFRIWVTLMEQQAAVGHKTIDLLVLYALLGERD